MAEENLKISVAEISSSIINRYQDYILVQFEDN